MSKLASSQTFIPGVYEVRTAKAVCVSPLRAQRA